MENLFTKDELKTIKTLYDIHLKDKYGVKSDGTVYKNAGLEYQEVEIEKSKGLFKKGKYKTGEIKYKISRIYFYSTDTPEGLISHWNDIFYLHFKTGRDMIDLLISHTKDFKDYIDNMERIGLKVTMKS